MTIGATTESVLRRAGELESAYDFWSRRHPAHFCLAAELSGPVDADDITAALRALSEHHPLLGTDIVLDAEDVALGHVVRHGEPPQVRVLGAPTAVADVIASELATPFPSSRPSSRFRAVVVPAGEGSWTVVLTLDHQIADGISTLRMVEDLASLLNRRPLVEPPFPVPREELLAAGHVEPAAETAPRGGPDLPLAAAREFDGAAPTVRTAELTVDETAALVERCRTEDATVNGAVVAACVQALGAERDFLRINVPVDLRKRTGSDVGVGLYMGNANLTFQRPFANDFWSLAREASTDTRRSAEVPALRAASDAIAGAMQAGMGEAELEPALLAGLGFELLVSNLGVLPDAPGPVEVRAVWGPAVLVQIQGEHMLGVTTAGGRLRLVYVSHEPWPDVVAPLLAAVRG